MNTRIRILLPLFFSFFLFANLDIAALASEDELSGQSKSSTQAQDAGFNPALWFISIYKDHISPVDADRCPSVPTCSSYAEQAFKKHGFFMGWMMTVDRLIHEGSEETSVSPLVRSQGKLKIYDPVENNDFWWFSRDREDHE
jgi:putative component of membrane protein insertase Oxa1/YidC/SpoIIIJ protein YidD